MSERSKFIAADEYEDAVWAVEETLANLGVKHEAEARLILEGVLANWRQRTTNQEIRKGSHLGQRSSRNEESDTDEE